ncbi:MAG TPA: hypothetical protein VFP47_11605 [Pyrinomonadaceae bacterium]|nr:hypothetical protein [Pyrinomonadaceae bacterium]
MTTKISEALGKLAALEKGDDLGKTEGPAKPVGLSKMKAGTTEKVR